MRIRPAVVCAAVFFAVILRGNLTIQRDQQYIALAESFLVGKLYFVQTLDSWSNASPFGGHFYWPTGPLPALILMPLVAVSKAMGISFRQGYLSLLLAITAFFLCFRLARKTGYSDSDSLWLSVAFCLATSFLGVAAIPWSWYLAHLVAVNLLFLSILEYLGERRWPLIGLFIGLAAAARPPSALNLVFFALSAFFGTRRELRLKAEIYLLSPFAFLIAILAAYNFARFGSPLESGYTYQLMTDHLEPNIFATENVARHLPVFLFGLPIFLGRIVANPDGMGIFLISPFLLYIFFPRRFDREDIMLILGVTMVTAAFLAFRSTGSIQFGYRFSLDFMPFLFLCMMRRGFGSGRLLPTGFKIMVITAVLSDLYLFWSFVNVVGELQA